MRGFAARSSTAVKDLVCNPWVGNVGCEHGALPLNEHAVLVEALRILKAVKSCRYLDTVGNKASLYCRNAFLLKLFYERILIDLMRIESDSEIERL